MSKRLMNVQISVEIKCQLLPVTAHKFPTLIKHAVIFDGGRGIGKLSGDGAKLAASGRCVLIHVL